MASTEQRKIQIIADGSQVNATFNDMAAAARLLQNQLKKLPPESEEFAKKSEQLKGVKKNMNDLKGDVFGTEKALQGMNTEWLNMTPLGGMIQGITGAMGKAKAGVNMLAVGFKTLRGTLISTGIGALVVALGALISYLTTTQDGIDKVNKVLTPMRVIFQKLEGVVQNLGGNLFKGLGELLNGELKNGFNTLRDGASQAGEELSTAFTEGIDQGAKLAQMNIDIEKTEINLIKRRAELAREYKEASEIAENVAASDEERRKAAQLAIDVTNERLQLEQQLIDKQIEKMEMEQGFNDTSRADNKELQELYAKRIEMETQASEARTTARSKLNTVNQSIEAEDKKAHQEYIKRMKEQEKAEEAKQAKLTELRNQYIKASEEAEKTLQDLRISLMEEGQEKQEAQLDIQLSRELAAMEKKRDAILQNEILTEQQRQELIDQFAEMAELKRQERKEKQAELEEEEREADIEKQFEQFDEDQERETLLLEISATNAIDAEYTKKEKLLQIQREYAAEKLAILEAAGEGEGNQALKLKAQITSIDKEIADNKIEQAERAEEFKRELQQQALDTAKNFLQLGLDLMDEEAKGRKQLATALKAIQIGEIISAGIKEVQAIWASVANLGPIAGPIIGGIQTGIAVSRSLMSINKIRSTKYASGGATGGGSMIDMMMGSDGKWSMPDGTSTRWVGSYAAGGHVGSPSFGVIGEKGSEWVGPNWMLRSPKYADIFGYLESERQRASAYAVGGATIAAGNAAPDNNALPADQNSQKMMNEFRQLRAVMEDMRNLIAAWPDRLRVINDPRDIMEGIQVLNEIEADSRISR